MKKLSALVMACCLAIVATADDPAYENPSDGTNPLQAEIVAFQPSIYFWLSFDPLTMTAADLATCSENIEATIAIMTDVLTLQYEWLDDPATTQLEANEANANIESLHEMIQWLTLYNSYIELLEATAPSGSTGGSGSDTGTGGSGPGPGDYP